MFSQWHVIKFVAYFLWDTESAARANSIDCGGQTQHASASGESLCLHKQSRKKKIKSNIPGLIILKQIQPRTYALAGFLDLWTIFPSLVLSQGLRRIWLSNPGLFLAGQWFAWSALLHFTMELWNWAWEKKTRIQTQSALSVSSSSWFVYAFLLFTYSHELNQDLQRDFTDIC